MKILVPTCDKYTFLIEPYHLLFNKYWPGNEIVFLGFDESLAPKLPDNCSFVSLGKMADFGKVWTDPIRPYIQHEAPDHFVFSVEDMVLCDDVDIYNVEKLEYEVANGRASKAILDDHLIEASEQYFRGVNIMHRHAPYRTTLHPCIWRKDYFLKYLKPGYTAWDFEVRNMRESILEQDVIIMLSKGTPPIFNSANIFDKGRPAPRMDKDNPWGATSRIKKDDALLIYSYIPKEIYDANIDAVNALQA